MAAKPIPVPAADAEVAIRALAKEFETLYNARNIEKLVALFAIDGRLMPMFREAAQGPNALRTMLKEGFERHDPRNHVIETKYVEFSGDLGFSIGVSTHNMLLPDGKRGDDRGKWVTTLRREGGQWKIVALTYTTDLPQAPIVR